MRFGRSFKGERAPQAPFADRLCALLRIAKAPEISIQFFVGVSPLTSPRRPKKEAARSLALLADHTSRPRSLRRLLRFEHGVNCTARRRRFPRIGLPPSIHPTTAAAPNQAESGLARSGGAPPTDERKMWLFRTTSLGIHHAAAGRPTRSPVRACLPAAAAVHRYVCGQACAGLSPARPLHTWRRCDSGGEGGDWPNWQSRLAAYLAPDVLPQVASLPTGGWLPRLGQADIMHGEEASEHKLLFKVLI